MKVLTRRNNSTGNKLTQTVVLYDQDPDRPFRWDVSLEGKAEKHSGERIGSGTDLRTMERDICFEFPTEEKAAAFAREIQLFIETTFAKEQKF